MTQHRDVKRQYWFLYPLLGIRITDKEPDFDDPLFGDSTIVSRHHLTKFSDDMQVLRMGFLGFGEEEISAFLAVRWAGRFPALSDEFGTAEYDKRSLLEAKASMRARQVAACVGLSFLSRRRGSFGLADDYHLAKWNTLVLDRAEKTLGITTSARGMPLVRRTSEDSMESLGRDSLRRFLLNVPCSDINRMLLWHDIPPRRSDLKRTIGQVAELLFAASHVSSTSSQILTAVTAIEVLLADRTASYSALQSRVKALVGGDVASRYGLAEIIEARHGFVHEGRAVDDDYLGLSYNAVFLGLICLVIYSKLAWRFTGKQQILDYLDLVTKGDRVQPFMTPSEREHFKAIITHERHAFGMICFRTRSSVPSRSRTLSAKKEHASSSGRK